MTSEKSHSPYVFDEFFASGKEESVSPFLTQDSKKWGKNLPLRSSFLSASCLIFAFVFSFFSQDLSYIFLLVVYALSGTPALIGAIKDIQNLDINIDVLMTLAALLSALIGSGLEGALLLVLFEISGAMEGMVSLKTKSALISLSELSPLKAWILSEDGHLLEKSVREIPVGTFVIVKASEIVPLDGLVVQGTSFVNLSHLTGESIPLSKKPGDEVPAGARNLDGSLTIQVTASSQDSTLHKIIELMTDAMEAKPKLQQWIDTFGKRYAVTIILLTCFFAIFLPYMFPIPYLGIEGSVYRALAFLIAASPCALVIATPTAYLAALSSCAKNGILLKGGAILDALARCKHIAFDKTGTLTTGNLRLLQIESLNISAKSLSLDEVLIAAASLERVVKHPIADAIIAYAKEQNLPLKDLTSFTSIPGSGIEAVFDKIPCFLGNESFIRSKLKTTEKMEISSSISSSNQTYFLMGDALFIFHFQDEVRSEAKKLIDLLKNTLFMNIAMLTGDHHKNAFATASKLGITNVFADLKPQDKLDRVSLLSQDHGMIMVGDGVNDAPALARATVGISMGKVGSASAVDASDAVLLQDDLSCIGWLIIKARLTMRIVKQNFSLALAVITFVTTPALLGWVPLWCAVLFHEGGTVLVGLNSLRLLKKKKDLSIKKIDKTI